MSDSPPEPSPSVEIDGLLEHAVRAPSLLNTQPWRFVVDQTTVYLYADRSRQLPALDPRGRELTMSCGAALLYLRVAARHAGWEAEVHPFPVPDEADLLAAVTLQQGGPPDEHDDRLFRALAHRRTNRHPFSAEPPPAHVYDDLVAAAAAEGATLHVFEGEAQKGELSNLVAAGIIEQGQDREVVADIQAWLRPAKDPRPDGVRDSVQGMWDRHASMRTPPTSVAAYKRRLVQEAPAILVLSTDGDGPDDWLAAGQALARALVVAADRGLAASYVNEPLEVDGLRGRVATLIGAGAPQAVFRIGYPEARPETARRPARDVTRRADGSP